MKTKLLWLFIFSLIFCTNSLLAQHTENKPQGVSSIGTLNYKYVPSIAEQIRTGTFIPETKPDASEINPKMRHGAKVIPGKGSKGADPLAERQLNAEKIPTRSPSLVFNTSTSTGTPSDPTGAVGRDFYIAAWNTSFQIFDKDGTPAAGMPSAASNSTVFGSTIGDPIVLYDSAADRYILTQFSDSPNGFEVAISQTNNPITGGWHVYSSSNFSTGTFPDYTKFAIWSDAYYVTANINGGTGQVFAIERNEMLNGNPSTIQAFNLPGLVDPIGGFYGPQVFSVTDDNLPASGGATFVYQQDDAYSGVAPGNDHFKLWTLDVDWDTPANSVMSAATEFPVSAFNGVFDGGSFTNLTQPGGGDVDALQALIANQPQFRRFGTHNSAVFNHVVDVGSGTEQAAVRWYELRQTADNQPWTLHQEGTYVAPDGRHAWNASMAMDAAGNIGMGYTTMGGSGNTLISSAYTGQFAGAPSNVMNALEEFIVVGTGLNGSNRYADYSHLTVDPSDDASFWFVNEVFTPGRTDVVGVFQLTAPAADDVGVTAITAPTNGVLTASETIMINIRNYGSNSQSNIPVSYTIDGGGAINDTYPGPLAAGATDSFSFAVPADLSVTNQTYTVVATTNLGGDANAGNDSTTAMVTNAVQSCEPSGNCSFDDGVTVLQLGTLNHSDITCTTGYIDSTNESTDLDRVSGNNVHNGILQSGWAEEHISMWIDFNDDGDFVDAGELVLDTFVIPAGQANTDQNFQITIPTDANLGPHILRTRGKDPDFGGTLNDPCGDLTYGNTEDFTVNIIDSVLSIGDFDLDGSELAIISKPNDQYEITLSTSYSDKLTFNLFNMLGQQLVFNVISKGNDGKYVYELDMSYASSGVYIVKVGKGTNFQVGRIIVN